MSQEALTLPCGRNSGKNTGRACGRPMGFCESMSNIAKFGLNSSRDSYAPVISKCKNRNMPTWNIIWITACHVIVCYVLSSHHVLWWHILVSQRTTLLHLIYFSIFYSHWLSSLDLEKQLWYFSWQTRLNSLEVFIISTDFWALQLAYLSHQLKLAAICWNFEYYFIVPIIFKWKCSHFLQITHFHASYLLWHISL